MLLINAPEFFIIFFRSRAVDCVRFFSSLEYPKMLSFPVEFYADDKTSGTMFANAFVSRSIISLQSPISLVLRGRGFSKVAPTIVVFYTVLVIDFKFWPFPSLVKPNNSMNHVFFVGDSYFKALSIKISCFVTDMNAFRQAFFPKELSCFGFVPKYFSNEFVRQIALRIFVAALHVNPCVAYRRDAVNA